MHWYEADKRELEKKREAKREDGQLLILPSETLEEAGALSGPTFGSPSEGKDNSLLSDKQEKGTDSSDGLMPITSPSTPVAPSDNLSSSSGGKGNALSADKHGERRKSLDLTAERWDEMERKAHEMQNGIPDRRKGTATAAREPGYWMVDDGRVTGSRKLIFRGNPDIRI